MVVDDPALWPQMNTRALPDESGRFTLQCDDDGTEFLTFDKGLTKTRQAGLSFKLPPKCLPQEVREDAQSCCLS